MAEKKQFHFAAETSLGYIEGDLHLEIEGNDMATVGRWINKLESLL